MASAIEYLGDNAMEIQMALERHNKVIEDFVKVLDAKKMTKLLMSALSVIFSVEHQIHFEHQSDRYT